MAPPTVALAVLLYLWSPSRMRARHAALAPALITLALAGAGCGGSDDEQAAAPTPTAAAQDQTGSASGGAAVDASTPEIPDSSQVDTGIKATDSLLTQLAKNPDLRTLSTTVNSAALASTLEKGDYTVFAPNNDAFTKLGTQLDALLQPTGKPALQNILKYHIVKGKVRARELKNGKLLTSLQGSRLRVTVKDGQTMIGNSLGKATILVPDAKASNGVIHTIDTVLKPKS